MPVRPVVGDEIHQQADAAGMGAIDQFLEVLLRTQPRIDVKEAGCIVAVIARAGEDRRQPQAVHAEAGNIVQLVDDAAQGSVGFQ